MKAVFDCNIFAQALMNPIGPAGACVQAVFDGQAAKPWSADFRARFPDLQIIGAEQLLAQIRKTDRPH